jgi:Winged helix DNA-binding domain
MDAGRPARAEFLVHIRWIDTGYDFRWGTKMRNGWSLEYDVRGEWLQDSWEHEAVDSSIPLTRAPSVLVIASHDMGDARDGGNDGAVALCRSVTKTGGRVLDCVAPHDASDRLARIVDVDIVMLDCRGILPTQEALIARIDMLSLSTGTAAIFITDLEGVDCVDALVSAPAAHILLAPDEGELLLSLNLALASRHVGFALHDRSRDDGAPGLGDLSDELGRLSGLIESLLHRGDAVLGRTDTHLHARKRSFTAEPFENEAAVDDLPLDAARIRAVLRARRLRDQIIAGDLFADPAWDIMLDLMAARLEGLRVSVSSLCIAAAVPPTTALRWIRQLTDRGLLIRQADNEDGRRIFIALSDEGAQAVQRWFALAGPLLGGLE